MNKSGIKVIDHTTGITYPSIANAAKSLYITRSGMHSLRKRKGQIFIFNGHDLEFSEDVRKFRKCPVRCIETGEVYRSILEASEKVGVTYSYMKMYLAGKVKAVKGLHFERIENDQDQ